MEDGPREAGVGGRLGQIRCLTVLVASSSSHLLVLLRVGGYGWRVRHVVRVLVALGHVGGDQELLDVVVVAGQILGHGHTVLCVHSIGHAHAVRSGRGDVPEPEGTAQRRGAGVSVIVVGSEGTTFRPAGRSQGPLAVHAGRRGRGRVQRREAGGHGGALAGAQRWAVDFDRQTVRHVTLRSHFVCFFRAQILSRERCINLSTCRLLVG